MSYLLAACARRAAGGGSGGGGGATMRFLRAYPVISWTRPLPSAIANLPHRALEAALRAELRMRMVATPTAHTSLVSRALRQASAAVERQGWHDAPPLPTAIL